MKTRLKALIVEDNQLVQKVHKRILQELNYQVDVANNGSHASELFIKHFYEIALIDLSLPDVSGIEIIKLFRKHSNETKVIVVTTYITDAIIKNCSDAGSNTILEKPIKIEDLQ